MTQQEHWLEIIDKDNWQIKQPLDKRIFFIGSHPSNDICLASDRGTGVAPKHIQLILNQVGYKLVNISDENVIVNTPTVQLVSPHGAMNIGDGYSIQLGDFTLILHGGSLDYPTSSPILVSGPTGGDGEATNERKLELQVALPRTQLAPHKRLDGIVVVRNIGEASGVKIDLELRGVDSQCFHIDSGPLLSAGAEKNVRFYIEHIGHLPPAGPLHIEIEATASKAYPLAWPVVVSQTIKVLPYYSHKLTLRDPDALPLQSDEPQTKTSSTEAAEPTPPPVSPKPASVPPSSQPQILSDSSVPVVAEKRAKVTTEIKVQKTVKSVSDAPIEDVVEELWPSLPPSPPTPTSTPSDDVPAAAPFEPISPSHQEEIKGKEQLTEEPTVVMETVSIEKKLTEEVVVAKAEVLEPELPNQESRPPVGELKILNQEPEPSDEEPDIPVQESKPLIEEPKSLADTEEETEREETPVQTPSVTKYNPPPAEIKTLSNRKITTPPRRRQKAEQNNWWKMEEEEETFVVKKETIVKIQSKPQPSLLKAGNESSDLTEDWVANDED